MVLPLIRSKRSAAYIGHLDARDADLAVALGGVRVAAGEERARDAAPAGTETRALRDVAGVHVAAERVQAA